MISNTEIESKDVRRAEDMHGYNVAKLRGTFKRAKHRSIPLAKSIVAKALIEKHKDIRIFIDIMFVNNILFLYTLSEGATFRTATFLLS